METRVFGRSGMRLSILGFGCGAVGGNSRCEMDNLDSPFVIFAVALLAQGLAVYVGRWVRFRTKPLSEAEREDFDIVRAATLTLLGLIIGFSFSMAVTRYDQRKNYEEAEANAIGTEYIRTDLLPGEAAARTRGLLRTYLDRRIAFYRAHGQQDLAQIDADTAKLQAELWAAVSNAAKAEPTPVMAMVVSGMNDVINSQGYTQAAWWNRIPVAAWAMMGLIAVAANILVGYGARRRGSAFFVLPVVVSLASMLIADIDSPRGGIIRVAPQNLIALSGSLTTP